MLLKSFKLSIYGYKRRKQDERYESKMKKERREAGEREKERERDYIILQVCVYVTLYVFIQ